VGEMSISSKFCGISLEWFNLWSKREDM